MKTKEEIIGETKYWAILAKPLKESILEAMELYAQQLVSDRDREIAELKKNYGDMTGDYLKRGAELSSLKSLLGKCLPYLKEMNEDNIEDLSVGIRQDRELIDLLSDFSEQLDKK